VVQKIHGAIGRDSSLLRKKDRYVLYNSKGIDQRFPSFLFIDIL